MDPQSGHIVPCALSKVHKEVHKTLHSGAASGLREFLAKVEISAGLLELVQALLPEFKTVFRLNFKQVLRKI